MSRWASGVGEFGLEEAREGEMGGAKLGGAGGGGANAGGVLEKVLVDESLLLLSGAKGASKGAIRVLDSRVGSLEHVEVLLLVEIELGIADLRVFGGGGEGRGRSVRHGCELGRKELEVCASSFRFGTKRKWIRIVAVDSVLRSGMDSIVNTCL